MSFFLIRLNDIVEMLIDSSNTADKIISLTRGALCLSIFGPLI